MNFSSFIGELFKTWWGRLWSILAIISTVSTFAAIYVPGFSVPRWIPPAVAVVAWVLAPYRLLVVQQEEITSLRAKIGRPRLVIHPEGRCAFYVHREPPQAAGPIRMNPLGTYLEIDLTIENKGDVNSVISRFDVQIHELNATFANIQPQPRQFIQTREAQIGLHQHFVTRTNKLLVNGNNFVQGILPFYIQQSPADNVVELHCVLTVTGTDGGTASGVLVLNRRGG